MRSNVKKQTRVKYYTIQYIAREIKHGLLKRKQGERENYNKGQYITIQNKLQCQLCRYFSNTDKDAVHTWAA